MNNEEKMLEVIKKIANAKKEAKNAINQIAAYEYEQEIGRLTDELVGLYDALERRPAVQVAKTIEERTRDYSHRIGCSDLYCAGLGKGYFDGTTEQLKIDIDKACEWINANWRKYIDTDADGMIRFAGWKNGFKKYMEEE